MNRRDLINRVQDVLNQLEGRTFFSKTDAEHVLDGVVDSIKAELLALEPGESLTIRNFASFQVREREGRVVPRMTGRTRSGTTERETLYIPNYRILSCKFAPAMKDALNNRERSKD